MTVIMNDEANKIRQAAKNFVDRFGGEALERARLRAEQLRDAGNAGGTATWVKICDQIEGLFGDGAEKP